MTEGISDVHRRLAEVFFDVNSPTSEGIEQVRQISNALAEDTTDGAYAGRFLVAMVHAGQSCILSADDTTLVQGLLECLHHNWVSRAGWDMQHGVWDHFRGGVYLSDRVERCADGGEPRVSYLSLIYGTWHSRRAAQWNEVVLWPDGKYRSRFVYRGRDLSTSPPDFKVASPE
jgi:hypothetical protein